MSISEMFRVEVELMIWSSTRLQQFSILLVLASLLGGCVVSETRPIPKLEAFQAKQQIAETELLDVAIRYFDPGIPTDIAEDEKALDKRRIYPEVRRAESRLLAARLRSTLEGSGQWGAVRVVPNSVRFVDVIVEVTIIESTGGALVLEVSATDVTGQRWIESKRYAGESDLSSYKTDAALRARDPFQNVYASIANDLLAARERLTSKERRELRQVSQLRFAADLDPKTFLPYLVTSDSGQIRLQRLPAADDPALLRIEKIRERDAMVMDTLDGYTGEFSDKLFDSYGAFRRTSREAIEREDKARNQAVTRTALGAAAVLASIFVKNSCNPGDYNCERIDDALRTVGTVGGVTAIVSGIKKFSDAKSAAQEVKELTSSFESEVAGQVVEVEGRSLKLVGTAEEQYREWRRLLAAIYIEEQAAASAP